MGGRLRVVYFFPVWTAGTSFQNLLFTGLPSRSLHLSSPVCQPWRFKGNRETGGECIDGLVWVNGCDAK